MSSSLDAYHDLEAITPSPGSQFTLQIEIKGAQQHEQWMWAPLLCPSITSRAQIGQQREKQQVNSLHY